MIRRKEIRKQEIDLKASQGNAFYIIGAGKNLHRDLTREGVELPPWEEIRKDMTSSDYNHLTRVFDKYFGDYIDLVY